MPAMLEAWSRRPNVVAGVDPRALSASPAWLVHSHQVVQALARRRLASQLGFTLPENSP